MTPFHSSFCVGSRTEGEETAVNSIPPTLSSDVLWNIPGGLVASDISTSCGCGVATVVVNSVSRFSIEPWAERSSGESLSFTSATSNVLCEMEEGTMVEEVVEPVVVVGEAVKGRPGRDAGQVGSEIWQDGRLVGMGEGLWMGREGLWTGKEGAEVRQRMDLLGSLWVVVGEELWSHGVWDVEDTGGRL